MSSLCVCVCVYFLVSAALWWTWRARRPAGAPPRPCSTVTVRWGGVARQQAGESLWVTRAAGITASCYFPAAPTWPNTSEAHMWTGREGGSVFHSRLTACAWLPRVLIMMINMIRDGYPTVGLLFCWSDNCDDDQDKRKGLYLLWSSSMCTYALLTKIWIIELEFFI